MRISNLTEVQLYVAKEVFASRGMLNTRALNVEH
jgi:hypothetical protein